jgi:hypothetical protein
MFAKDLQGCAVDPFRIIDDGSEDDYLNELATFEDH